MGNCFNKDTLEKQLIEDFKEEKKTLKLLLLGAAASGKSTMLKQMHFFNSIDRISQSNYVPTIQDILLLRVPTSGIVEVQFNVNRFPFRVFDVGGQRNERRKWIHCFDNVQAIIFVAAVNEFDQTLEEDENTNRLIESLHLFKSICMAKWFINTGIILFLNKTDLFEQKIAGKKSIKQLFPSYTGSNSYSDQLDFIQQNFLAMNSNPSKQVYAHRTCATNTDQMELVLKNVFELVLASLYNKASMY
uniref:Uncharacterized protein n=1 Tax=Meloidogyne javanica TaxID=6303 RepID=A0A915LMX4_MELJA